MNRFTKVYVFLLVATGACTCLSLAFAAIAEKEQPGLARNAISRFFADKAGQEYDQADETFDLDQSFDRVHVGTVLGGIEIVAADELAKPRLHFVGALPKNGERPWGFKVENGELKIQLKSTNPNNWHFIFNGTEFSSDGDELKTILELPRAWKGSLDLEAVNYDISVSGVNAEKMDLKTVNGSVQTGDEVSARRVVAATVGGDVELYGRFGDVKANTVSGDVEVGLPGAGSWKVRVATVSGDTENTLPKNGDGKDGSVEINTVSGDVRVSPLEQKEEEDHE